MKIKGTRKAVKQIISFFTATVLAFNCLPMNDIHNVVEDIDLGFVQKVFAANPHEIGSTYTINKASDLISLSQKDPSTYQYSLIYFADAITDKLTAAEYTPLGSEQYPFKGRIRINQMNQSNFSFISDVPLFDCIADSVEITFNNDTGKPPIAFQRSEYNTGLPLFANHVVHDADTDATLSAGWVFQVDPFTDTSLQDNPVRYYSYAGLIGTVGTVDDDESDPGDGTIINIEFTNYSAEGSSYGDVYSNSNAGLICGTMNKGSTVNVKLSGFNTNYSVESTSGSAGRFVGAMYDGSKLNITTDTSAFLSNSSAVTATEYAGGIVGYCKNGTVNFIDTEDRTLYASGNGTITSGTDEGCGAGGLYGYYENTSAAEFDLSKVSVTDCIVSGKNAGGLFGKLVSNADITVKNGSLTVAAGTGVSYFGGIAGSYKANNGLTDKLLVSNITANTSADSFASGNSYYGGVTGYIDTNNAYVEVSGFIHDTTDGCNQASVFGGVIATTADTASMTNISGNFTLDTNGTELIGGGVIGYMNKGVLRLSGMTDMSSAQVAESHDNGGAEDVTPSYSCGQIVGYRDAALIYAVGSGNNYTAAPTDPETEIATPASGWSFNRYVAGDQHVDDIDTWGEVVRVSSDSSNSDTLYFNSANHTVTIAAAETTMDSEEDFVRTALNIQLNGGSDVGSLCFANKSTSSSAKLLGTELNVSGTINLEGTGITGFTRDDGANGNFTGSLTGSSNATINLATGEYYGANIGSKSTLGNGRGEIYRHRYVGLFAKTKTNASFQNITLNGYINTYSERENHYISGLVAVALDGISISGCSITEQINNIFVMPQEKYQFLGGAIAEVDAESASDLNISNTVIATHITTSGTYSGDQNKKGSQITAGLIGRVSSVNSFKINLNNVTVSPVISIDTSIADLKVGGIIAEISSNMSSDTRTVNLNEVTVSGTMLSGTGTTSHMGGLLGYSWCNTNVVSPANNGAFGVKVTGTESVTNIITAANADYQGGLLAKATGYWNVGSNGIVIEKFSSNGGKIGFGMISLDGYNGTDSAIYLELNQIDSYKLSDTGVTVPTSSQFYDELITYTGSKVLENNCGVISIRTKDTTGTAAAEYSMDEANCNSYQNVYNTGMINTNSRYYYNVSANKDDTNAGSGWALLNWSLRRYAAANIRTYFADPTLSGTYDLTNISYYPVDLTSSDVTITNNITVIFHNDKIEATEKLRVSGEKLTSNESQHRLMHYGLFRNVSKGLTTNGDIHFKGIIGNDIAYSGALICGSLTGNYSSSKSKEIVLEGIAFNNASATSKYLLIHSIGDKASLTLSGVRTGGGLDFSGTAMSSETKYGAGASVADSLIGDVNGTGLTFDLSRLKLDARTEAGDDTIYGTTKSIFIHATLFNKLDTDGTSVMTYNYAEELDWNNETHIGSVTYGKEISDSIEYLNQEKQYYDDKRNYTNADSTPNGTSGTNFSTGYRPYVRWYSDTLTGAPRAAYSLRELKVNVKISGITVGCGTYNHPYEISANDQFPIIAKAISGTDMPGTLVLPMYQKGTDRYVNDDAELTSILKKHWCEDKKDCALFSYQNQGDYASDPCYTYNDGENEYKWGKVYVQKYLASAYYKVMNDITIEASSNYIGLGGGAAGGDYAFRGVIVGANKNVTITNESKALKSATAQANYNTMGLISTSHGCVVKDLTIVADISDSAITTIDNGKTYYWNYRLWDQKAYDYNEEFPNYGAVINKIMGGDNIIDNVTVKFTDNFKIQANNDKSFKATIGGYVGCVVNGGLIFRNVDDNDLQHKVGNSYKQGFVVNRTNESNQLQNSLQSDKTITNLTDSDNMANMFINPFVGRVINGYAIRETTDDPLTEENEARFAGSEDGKTYTDGRSRSGVSEVTMHNTRKNWSIPDINKDSSNILTFSEADTSAAIYKAGTYNKITVPDAQSLYIMSIIAQSGAGCASSELSSGNNNKYSFNISYNGNGQPTNKNVFKGNYKATHLAQYDQIGTNNTSDYNVSLNDSVGDSTAVPYLIAEYTSSYTKTGEQGGKPLYPARCLTQRTFAIELSSTPQTYYLPDSFRGIGFLGANNPSCNMKIYGINGHGGTIDMNTFCSTYTKGSDPYYGSTVNDVHVGIGLFSRVQQKDTKDAFTHYYNPHNVDEDEYENYQISNFTLTGYISGASCENVGTIKQNDSTHENYKNNYYMTGGVVGLLWNNINERYLNFLNLDFNDLYIQASGTGGALVSLIDRGMIYANNCNANNLTVEGGSRIGGFIGTADGKDAKSGFFVNANVPNASTTLNNIQIKQMGPNNSDKYNFAGGLIGGYWGSSIETYKDSSNKTINKASFIFNNITITSDNDNGSFIGCAAKENKGYVGGIIGNDERSAGCVVKNCKIEKTNMYGYCVGGILGANLMTTSDFDDFKNDSAGLRIVDCYIAGELDEVTQMPKFVMSGSLAAGGIIGYDGDWKTNSELCPYFNYDTYKYQVDGCLVKDYKITTTDTVPCPNTEDKFDGCGAGGLLGVINVETFTLVNSKVDGCVISTQRTSAERGVGGIIGYARNNGYDNTTSLANNTLTQGKLNATKGYNIVVSNNTLYNVNNSSDTQVGTIIGYATTNSTVNTDNAFDIEIAGFSRKGNKDNSGNALQYDIGRSGSETITMPTNFASNGSYIAYADFTGANFNKNWSFDDAGNADVSGLTKSGVENVDTMGAAPYATVLPFTSMGTDEVLTGDGAALIVLESGQTDEKNKLISKAIIDCDTNEKYGIYSSTDKTNVNDLIEASESASIRLTTYETEVGSSPTNYDFPIIAIGDGNDYSSELQSYVRVLTNTENNYFKEADNSKYAIDILCCQFDDELGRYKVITTQEPGLNYSRAVNELRMVEGRADSNQPNNQISVIDIKFFDPAYTAEEKVAYHLYIPVLTKKMIKYNFSSAAVSGSDYLKSLYTSKFGQNAAENYDNWITMYTRFTYPQTELQAVVDAGVGLNWNNDKIVRLMYTMNQSIGDNARFVLVDPNGNRDNVYYAQKSDAAVTTRIVNNMAQDLLDFSDFRDSENNTDFAPIDLNDLVTMTYSDASDAPYRVYVETLDPSEAVAYAYEDASGNGKKYFKKAPDGNTATTYALTVTEAAVEDYYISMYAAESDNSGKAYEFTVRSPLTLTGGRMSRLNTESFATVLLGELFNQSVKLLGLNTREIITTNNNYLNATAQSTITFIDSDNLSYVKGKFIDGAFELYQVFVLRLNRVDKHGNAHFDQQIHGGPNTVVTTDGSHLDSGEEAEDRIHVTEGASYIVSRTVKVNTPANISDNNWSDIVESTFLITFPANDEILEREFSSRQTGDKNGIYLSVNSNLAYNLSGNTIDDRDVIFSNNTKDAKRQDIVYYVSKESQADLMFDAINQEDIYDKNGKLSDNSSPLGLNAYYLEEGVTRENIKADIIFDLSQFSNIDSTNNVKFILSLAQKNDTSGYGGYGSVGIDDYIQNIKLFDASGNTQIAEFNSGNSYTVEFNKEFDENNNWTGDWIANFDGNRVELDYDAQNKIFTAMLKFDVLTGSELESVPGYKYANYRINLDASINTVTDLDAENNISQFAHNSDYIIYTNAKVNAEFVSGS